MIETTSRICKDEKNDGFQTIKTMIDSIFKLLNLQ